MELVNTNRLRLSLERTDSVSYLHSFKSHDHEGARRPETTISATLCGVCVRIKWRPDGKYGHSAELKP